MILLLCFCVLPLQWKVRMPKNRGLQDFTFLKTCCTNHEVRVNAVASLNLYETGI